MSTYTSADLATITEAIANGALTVRFSTPGGGDRSVTYRSLDELKRIREEILQDLGTSTPTRSKQTLLVGRKSC
jgi:DNA-directed RNA polymerase sigma subunit (sigma70/sigma32)